MNASEFSSPNIANIGVVRQLVVQSRENLVGPTLGDGKVLWSPEVPVFPGMNIITPTIVDNLAESRC